MGLFVYTRHTADCAHREDRFWRRCRCPKWIRGVVNGKAIRKSAETRSWEHAESKVRSTEQVGVARNPEPLPKVTIEEAIAAFLEDERSRHLSTTTTGQSKTLLEKQFIDWAQEQGLTELEQLTVPLLSKFRATWTAAGNNANTARRKHQRLSGFLWFCVRSEWLKKNPARSVKWVAERAKLNCGQCNTKHGNKCSTGPYCHHFFLHKFRHTFATEHLRCGKTTRVELTAWR